MVCLCPIPYVDQLLRLFAGNFLPFHACRVIGIGKGYNVFFTRRVFGHNVIHNLLSFTVAAKISPQAAVAGRLQITLCGQAQVYNPVARTVGRKAHNGRALTLAQLAAGTADVVALRGRADHNSTASWCF